MKITRTSKTRFYASMLCLLFVVGGAVLLFYTSLSIKSLERLLPVDPQTGIIPITPQHDMLSTWKHLNLEIAIGCGAGFFFSFLLFMGSFRSRVSKYMRIIERLDFSNPGPLNLAALRFPEEDEFGNLGQRLNRLVERLEAFDRMKGDRVRIIMAILRELGKHTTDAIAVLSPLFYIIYASEACITLLGVKEYRENMRMTAPSGAKPWKTSSAACSEKRRPRTKAPWNLRWRHSSAAARRKPCPSSTASMWWMPSLSSSATRS
jgi:hypothetical protein